MHPLIVGMLVAQIVAFTVFAHEGLVQWSLFRATRAPELRTYAGFAFWSALLTLPFMALALELPRAGYTVALHMITVFAALAMRSYMLSVDAFLDTRSTLLRKLAAVQPVMAIWPLTSAIWVLLGGQAFFLFDRTEPPVGIVLEYVHALEPRNVVHPAHAVAALALLTTDLVVLLRVVLRARPRDYFIVTGVWITCGAIALELLGMALGWRYAVPAIFLGNLVEVVRITYVSMLRTGHQRISLEHEIARQRQVIDAQLEALAAQAGLSSLGGLTRELGHELRGPLASALLYVQAAQRREAVSESHGNDQLLDRAHTALDHASTLVNALHHAGRPPDGRGEDTCALSLAVRDALAIAGPRVTATQMRVDYDVPEDLYVRGQRSELIQIVLNLVLNACDACNDLPDRWLSIDTTSGPSGVRMTFSDAGRRLPIADADTLFRPNLSTKPAAVGSGLGLAITRQIVRRLGGSIAFDTARANTTVVVELASPSGARSA